MCICWCEHTGASLLKICLQLHINMFAHVSVCGIMYKFLFSFISAAEASVPAVLTAFAAVLRLNAGDKERCLKGSSNVHPHTT